MGCIQNILYLFNFQFFFQQQSFCHQVFLIIQVGKIFSIFLIQHKDGFTAKLELCGQGRCHDFSLTAHVIIGHPVPKCKLLIENNGFRIEHLNDGFGIKTLWANIRQGFDDAGIPFLPAKTNLNPNTRNGKRLHLFRNGIGIGLGQG